MKSKNDLATMLEESKMHLRKGTLNQPVFSDILLDKECREELHNDTFHKRNFRVLYQKSVSHQANDLLQRSRHLFTAIPREEFLNLKTDMNSGENFTLAADNFNDLSNWVQIKILEPESYAKCVLIMEFWVDVMQECLNLYDYNSARAIFAALTSIPIDKIKQGMSERTAHILQKMNALSSYKNQYQMLRDAMFGACIPPLDIYKGILIMIKEGSKKDEHYILEEDPLVIGILNIITDMQKKNALISPKYSPALINRSSLLLNITEIADKINAKHKEGSCFSEMQMGTIINEALCEIYPDQRENTGNQQDQTIASNEIIIPSDSADEQCILEKQKRFSYESKIVTAKVIDDCCMELANFRKRSLDEEQTDNLIAAHKIFEKVCKRSASKKSKILDKYLNCMTALRAFVRSKSENETDEDMIIKVQVKECIKQLEHENNVEKKIEILSKCITALTNIPLELSLKKIFKPKLISIELLKKLRNALEKKQVIDSPKKITRYAQKPQRRRSITFTKQPMTESAKCLWPGNKNDLIRKESGYKMLPAKRSQSAVFTQSLTLFDSSNDFRIKRKTKEEAGVESTEGLRH